MTNRQTHEDVRIVDALQAGGGERFFDALIQAMATGTHIRAAHCLQDDMTAQVLMRFISRYKTLITSCEIDAKADSGCCDIELAHAWDPNGDQRSYAELESSYTASYYLTDCGGYRIFNATGGKQIDWHLSDTLMLIDPKPGEKILDIGCGRGELSYALAKTGADVTGVDYSSAAIDIANRTFKADGGMPSLRFVKQDIFLMEGLGTYDKMVMTDVVEHIEQDVLEKIFEKLSHSLSPNGVLVIHTAPNLEYYSHTYPKCVELAERVGCFLPKEPRSYYERLMHINEQTPDGLRQALERYFSCVQVWTGSAAQRCEVKTPEQMWEDIEIFAYASNSRGALEKLPCRISDVPDRNACHIRLSAADWTGGYGNATLDVTIENRGAEVITSERRHPINLCYHILDAQGRTVVFDGVRTHIQAAIRHGERVALPMRLEIPESLPKGRYTLRVTAVAEGYFWLDEGGENYTDAVLTVR